MEFLVENQKRRDRRAWLMATVILVGFGSVAIAIWAMATFGSIGSSLAYLRGERLIAKAYSQSFGTLVKDEESTVNFELINMAGYAIKIIGARTSCTCVLAEDLPATVGPGERKELHVRVSAGGSQRPGPLHQIIELYTNDPTQRPITLQVEGKIVDDIRREVSAG